MALLSLKESILHYLFLNTGWRSDRKIVVFESDDWGMIRMASKKAFNYFKKAGVPVESCLYNSNDMLENNEDLELLFETFNCVKDKNGNPAILTANNIVANPDFEKIKQSNFQDYFYEPFTATLQRYPNSDRVIELYKEGQNKNVFRPQFHGREHINVANWMKALQQKDKFAMMAFEHRMFSVHFSGGVSSCKLEYLDAFGNQDEIDTHHQIVKEGLELFKKIHSYSSASFIAPCYTWSSVLNKTLIDNGVSFLQGGRVQKEPVFSNGKSFKKKYHFTGQKNTLGQIYLTRNASFEVAENPYKDWVDSCMKEIELVFRFKKPAIISTHRVNFMGGLNPENRNRTLKQLRQLLIKITKTWPDVEFMSSDQFGHIIASN